MVELGCAEPEVLLVCPLLCLTPPVGRGLRAPRFGRLGDGHCPQLVSRHHAARPCLTELPSFNC